MVAGVWTIAPASGVPRTAEQPAWGRALANLAGHEPMRYRALVASW
ncbi:hypothetical protein [Micromonospora rubida]